MSKRTSSLYEDIVELPLVFVGALIGACARLIVHALIRPLVGGIVLGWQTMLEQEDEE